jgi:hypothetical protein
MGEKWPRILPKVGLGYLIKEFPVPTKRATVSLIKVKPYNILLIMLFVCICSYLKSVLRYKFLTLDVYHPDTLHLRQHDVRVRGYF